MSEIKNKVESVLKEVFKDKHFQLLAIMITGSHAYGMANKNSDTDISVVFLPPDDYLIGMKSIEQILFDKKKLGFEGQAYNFTKWFRLLVNQNPNILETIWLNENHYIYKDKEYFPIIFDKREELLSKKIKHTYCGYAHSQAQRLKRLNKNANSNERRLETIEKFGYDTKAMSHVFRLLNSGLDGLVDGKIQVLRPENHFLIAIREGKYTYEELLTMINKKFELIEEAYVRSSLRNSVDMSLANELHKTIISKWLKN